MRRNTVLVDNFVQYLSYADCMPWIRRPEVLFRASVTILKKSNGLAGTALLMTSFSLC